ncbi:hypothetical protein LEP1GSC188_3613 [Leptospira weilii serovar Topaz str. LT2116]|uniref:Uncharacterized protein n=1 Tax=Leptospira weilii serovar Topaz str. LT2116 TaxID=1088540 RepID=M3GW95_9LEPT|nr:hypothetical protein LEP1GSC188_3613 [Leptospira weilii serovar Topaz str. LT2116]
MFIIGSFSILKFKMGKSNSLHYSLRSGFLQSRSDFLKLFPNSKILK